MTSFITSTTSPQISRGALLVISLTVLLSGCATAPGRTTSADPLQGFNRGIYKFNDVVDRATTKPIAKGYQKVTPAWFRTGVNNFFDNLGVPWTMVNELLQGKPTFMVEQTGRFIVNSVAGIGGLFDVASKINLPRRDEDFGQTLAVWGLPSGPYLMLPVLGPSNIRDGFGRVPDFFGRPLHYTNFRWQVETGLDVLNVIEARERLLSTDSVLQKAFDPYGIIRDAWIQQREYQIYDGNPPEQPLEDDSTDPNSSTDTTSGATANPTSGTDTKPSTAP